MIHIAFWVGSASLAALYIVGLGFWHMVNDQPEKREHHVPVRMRQWYD